MFKLRVSFFALTLLVSVFALGTQAKKLEVSNVAKVMVGKGGERVTIVDVKGTGEALVAFDGVGGEFEGKVFLAKVEGYGEKVDYRTDYDDRKYVVVTRRESNYDIYPPESSDGISVKFNTKISENTKAQDVLKRFQQQLAK